jgi:hypothetical protein
MIQQAKPVFFCYYQAFKEGKNVVRLFQNDQGREPVSALGAAGRGH